MKIWDLIFDFVVKHEGSENKIGSIFVIIQPQTSKFVSRMSTENLDNGQLVDYDEEEEEIPNERHIQGNDNVESIKFDMLCMTSLFLELTMLQ